MMTKRLPQLILFDGATGAGKSSLLLHLRKKYSGNILVGTKLTTRQKRSSDNEWEFQFVEHIPEQYTRYSFNSVGHRYAIYCNELVHAIDRGMIYAISCVDRQIMGTLIAEYNTINIYVYRLWTAADLDALLVSRGTADLDLQIRKHEAASVASEYLEKLELYNHVVLNVGSKMDMLKQLSRILLSYGISSDDEIFGVEVN